MPPGADLVFLPPGDEVAAFAWSPPPRGAESDDLTPVRFLVAQGPLAVQPRVRAVQRLPIASLVDGLYRLSREDRTGVRATVALWAATVRFVVDRVRVGRVYLAPGAGGDATWRLGPLNERHRTHLDELAAAMPPAVLGVHAGAPSAPTVHAPDALLALAVDAICDAVVRTAGHARLHPEIATRLAPRVPPVVEAPRVADPPSVQLRIEPPRSATGAFVGVVQLTSSEDPDVTVDVDRLDGLPLAARRRFGADPQAAVRDAIGAVSHLWPAIWVLRRYPRIRITDEDLVQLLDGTATALGEHGLTVLLPTSLLRAPARASARLTIPGARPDGPGLLDLSQLLRFDVQVDVDGHALSEEETAALLRSGRSVARVGRRWVVATDESLGRWRHRTPRIRLGDAIAEALGSEEDDDGRVRLLLDDGETLEVDVDERIADVAGRLRRASDATSTPAPAALQATLRPYQERGLAWLSRMQGLGLGGLLADDMGLGKTMQVLALHLHRIEQGDHGRLLVVCDGGLLANWEREAARFAPSAPVRRYHGAHRSLEGLAEDEIVVTTYGIVRREPQLLAGVRWRTLAADEATAMKNPTSATARRMRQIPAGARFALTGTPVENHLGDLWALLDWSVPGLFGTRQAFRRRFQVPIERHGDVDATEQLGRAIAPFVLRRRKVDPEIAPDLPPKTELDRVVPLSDEQRRLYSGIVRETLARIEDADGIERSGLVFRLLTQLQKACNHPVHLLDDATDPSLEGRSGKLDALTDLVTIATDEGEQTLIFTRFVTMGHLLRDHLRDRGIDAGFLHGSLSLPQRQRLVDEFQEGGSPVLVMSLKAGGKGLNLTAASQVVHYDRWWNPAVEDQASDRAWRIGQHRPVTVHRLVCEGTMEDRIAQMLEQKRRLAGAVVDATGEAWLTELDDVALRELVTLDGVDG
ncbi:MAG: DEAD/DEAH box helicase [Solirubrobacteraceae bacterium]|nr:DEAD/DEAH box helicase [Solirubrobacteraceae bacterium]